MFSWLVPGTISGRGQHRVMRLQSFIVGRGIGFVSLAARVYFTKALFTGESQFHQPRHIERGHSSRNKPDQPEKLGAPEYIAREGAPENLIFRKESREDWYSTDGQPADPHCSVGYRKIFPEPAHSR